MDISLVETLKCHYIPAALKLFAVKPLTQFLYGVQLGPVSSFAPVELVQSKCLRLALHVPKCVSYATLKDLMKVEDRMWMTITILNYLFAQIILFPSLGVPH